MKKLVISLAILATSLSLVACSGEAGPVPTITVTEESIQQDVRPESQGSEQDYLDFVKNSGGIYAMIASDSDLLSLGSTICNGFESGLSQDDVVYAVSQSLVENGMGDEDGVLFGAALISGAQIFLCSSSI